MYLLFLDESGTPEDKCFVLGGVTIRADQWNAIHDQWQAAVSAAGWFEDREFKWDEVRRSTRGSEAAAPLYECLAGLPLQCLATVIKPSEGDEAIRRLHLGSPEEIYRMAIKLVAERFQRFLVNQDSYGIIVVDSRRDDEDNRLRQYFEAIHEDGTEFAQLDRIVDGLFLGPSHFSLGLQLADLVVGPTRARESGPGDGSRYFREIAPLFMSHPVTGRVDGVGLKYFPDDSAPPEMDRLFDPRS